MVNYLPLNALLTYICNLLQRKSLDRYTWMNPKLHILCRDRLLAQISSEIDVRLLDNVLFF